MGQERDKTQGTFRRDIRFPDRAKKTPTVLQQVGVYTPKPPLKLWEAILYHMAKKIIILIDLRVTDIIFLQVPDQLFIILPVFQFHPH